ncbi:MAG: hypothetical protein ACRCX2_21055 [Paraclostridium sp.]
MLSGVGVLKEDLKKTGKFLSLIDNSNIWEEIDDINCEDMFLERKTKREYRVCVMKGSKQIVKIEYRPGEATNKRFRIEFYDRMDLKEEFRSKSKISSCNIAYRSSWLESFLVALNFINNSYTYHKTDIDELKLIYKIKRRVVYK